MDSGLIRLWPGAFPDVKHLLLPLLEGNRKPMLAFQLVSQCDPVFPDGDLHESKGKIGRVVDAEIRGRAANEHRAWWPEYFMETVPSHSFLYYNSVQ